MVKYGSTCFEYHKYLDRIRDSYDTVADSAVHYCQMGMQISTFETQCSNPSDCHLCAAQTAFYSGYGKLAYL